MGGQTSSNRLSRMPLEMGRLIKHTITTSTTILTSLFDRLKHVWNIVLIGPRGIRPVLGAKRGLSPIFS